MARYSLACAAILAVLATASCAPGAPPPATAADAKVFLDNANQTMLKHGIQGKQAGWVQQNFITDDTEALNARINLQLIDAQRLRAAPLGYKRSAFRERKTALIRPIV